MLYDCYVINEIWTNISNAINFKITLKEIVCGYVNYDNSKLIKTVNHIITLVSYAIFKNNSKSKFNDDHVYDVESIRFQICSDIKSFLRYITYPGIENKFEMRKIHNVLNIFT